MQDNTIELPENQIYHILKNGETEPIGPFSQKQIVYMLEHDQLSSYDYVHFREWEGWKRLSQVFPTSGEITHDFCEEGQDPDIVNETFDFMDKHAYQGEELYYIAVQHLPALSLTAAVRLTMPKSVILTNRRFCILEPKLVGNSDFDEYPIELIEGGVRKVKNSSSVGSFNIVLRNGNWIEIGKIPIRQLDKLTELSQAIVRARNEANAV